MSSMCGTVSSATPYLPALQQEKLSFTSFCRSHATSKPSFNANASIFLSRHKVLHCRHRFMAREGFSSLVRLRHFVSAMAKRRYLSSVLAFSKSYDPDDPSFSSPFVSERKINTVRFSFVVRIPPSRPPTKASQD